MKRLSATLVNVPFLDDWPAISVKVVDIAKFTDERLEALYEHMWDEIIGLRAEYSMEGDIAMEKGKTTSRAMQKVEKVMDIVWDCMEACKSLLTQRGVTVTKHASFGRKAGPAGEALLERVAEEAPEFWRMYERHWEGKSGSVFSREKVLRNKNPKALLELCAVYQGLTEDLGSVDTDAKNLIPFLKPIRAKLAPYGILEAYGTDQFLMVLEPFYKKLERSLY